MDGDSSTALLSSKKLILDYEVTFRDLLDIYSLEFLACVKIVYELWKPEMLRVFQDKQYPVFESMVPKILDKVKFLPLTDITRHKMEGVVKLVGRKLYSWVHENSERSVCSLKNMPLICWTPNSEIDEKKTFESLAHIFKPDELIKPRVLVAACNLCSEESVFFILKKIQERNAADRTEFSSRVLSFLKDESDPEITYLLYWLNCVINTNIALIYNLNNVELVNFFDNSLHRISILNPKYMAEFSLLLDNPYALKYFWSQLSNEEKDGILRKWLEGDDSFSVHPVITHKHLYSRTFLFLFSHLSGSQQRELSRVQSECIHDYFCGLCDWQFLRCIEKIIDMFDDDFNFKTFELIVHFKRDSSIVKSFLQCCSMRLRKHIFSHFYYNKYAYVFFILFEIYEADLLKMIIGIVDFKERKHFLFDFFQQERINIYTNKSVDFKILEKLNILIENSDMNSNEITNFKRMVLENYVKVNIKHWESDWKILDTFLEWAFCTPNEIINFKKLNFGDHSIVRRFMDQYCEYENVNEFLFWVFSGAEDEISLYKRKWAFCTHNVLLCGSIGRNFEGFTKFLNWSMSSADDIDNFKALIGSDYHLRGRISDIFRFDERPSKFCEDILKWCLDSKERILQFKRLFLLTSEGRKIIYLWIGKNLGGFEREDRMSLKELACFFSPLGKETVRDFKKSFISKCRDDRIVVVGRVLSADVDTFFQWLDKFNDVQS